MRRDYCVSRACPKAEQWLKSNDFETTSGRTRTQDDPINRNAYNSVGIMIGGGADSSNRYFYWDSSEKDRRVVRTEDFN